MIGSCNRERDPAALCLLARPFTAGRGFIMQRAVEEMTTGTRGCAARDRRDTRSKRSSVRPAAAHPEGEHAVEHCRRTPVSVSNGEGIKGEMRWQRTSGDECLGMCLTAELCEGERRAHTFEGAEVAVDH